MKVHKRYCNPVEEIHKELGDITSSMMYADDEDRYELLERKDVLDSDGFCTEYSLYYDIAEDRWVTVFGDSDIYRPEDEEFDAEFDDESEAESTDDLEILAKLANDESDRVRYAIVQRVDDPEILAKLANDEDYYIRRTAANRAR